MYEEEGCQHQQRKDAHHDDRHAEHLRIVFDSLLIVVLDDIQYRRDLPGAHTGVETVVAVPREADIAVRAVQVAISIQQFCQREERCLIHHGMAHIAQCRLRQPVFAVIIVVAAHPTIIAGDGVVAAVRIQPAQPLVADLTGFHILVARRQFLDPVHQVILILMVNLCEERVAPGGLLPEILLLHRRDDGVVAQLTIDVHLRLVVVAQSDAVELLFVDALQEGECLIVIAHGGTLEGLQR